MTLYLYRQEITNLKLAKFQHYIFQVSYLNFLKELKHDACYIVMSTNMLQVFQYAQVMLVLRS